MAALLQDRTTQDLVICLISGGGSALMPLPAPGISLADLQSTTSALLACGASIDQINTVRKHLDQLKGGGLARLAFPAALVTLVLSDVIGDPLDVIASGPTVPDPTTFAEATGDPGQVMACLRSFPLAVRAATGTGRAPASFPKPPSPAIRSLNRSRPGRIQQHPGRPGRPAPGPAGGLSYPFIDHPSSG